MRELREDARPGLLDFSLRLALRDTAVFDHSGRSARGELVSVAYHFEFRDRTSSQVQAGDDAAVAQWVPIEELPARDE